jgi:predicted AlkP superfamily pyrophosphatase or phosphodiesterase
MQKRYMSSFIRVVFVVTGVAVAARFPLQAAPANDHIVVMISVDGLAAYYLDDPKADVPTLRKLAAEGARAASMKAVTPTVTWPNHTTLVTGDYPARHGVVGNNYYDRAAGKKMVLIADPVFDKDQIVKVPTIYDTAKAAGMKTAAIRWPATRNASTLDWTEPDVHSDELVEKYTTPALLKECEAAGIHLLRKNDPHPPEDASEPNDDVYTKALNLILREHRPQLALLHIARVDHTEHSKGPRSADAYAAVHEADGFVHDVWEELQKDYPGKATLIVVSDHGFSPINKMILPNVVLAKAGLAESGEKKVDGAVQIVTQGGAVFMYVRDEAHRKEVMAKIRKAFSGLEGISKIVGSEDFEKWGVADPKDDPHAPDMILFAKEGYSFGDTAGGQLPFNEKPERKGSHGHDPSIPDLHATFIAWGAGIKPGVKLGEIKNIDVAPTIAELLNLEFSNTDGQPLEKILAK